MLKKIFPNLKQLRCNFFSTKTIDLIKILRAETNSPLNHIKKALEETNNNLDEAKIWLKKKGFKDAENRMTRSANTKLIGIKGHGSNVAVCSLSCETDFVAGTDLFKKYTEVLMDLIANYGKSIPEDQYSSIVLENYIKDLDNQFKSMNILDGLKHVISKTQENCKIGDFNLYSYGPNDLVGVYIHNASTPNAGLKGSYVVLSSNKKIDESLKSFAEKLAMQVVASNPKFLSKETVPADRLAEEKKILTEAVLAEGKKPELVEKIVASKLNGWFEDNVLNEQIYVIIDHDEEAGKAKVAQVVQKKGKEVGLDDLHIRDFKLFI